MYIGEITWMLPTEQQKIKLYCFFKVTIVIKVAHVGIFLKLSFFERLSQTWSFFSFFDQQWNACV